MSQTSGQLPGCYDGVGTGKKARKVVTSRLTTKQKLERLAAKVKTRRG